MKVLHIVAACLLSIFFTNACAAPITNFALTAQDPKETELSLEWTVVWDGSFRASEVRISHFVDGNGAPLFKWWIASFAISDLDGDRIIDDLSVTLIHKPEGPTAKENIPHAASEPYIFTLNNPAGLPDLGRTTNVPGSVKPIKHPATGAEHHDKVRIEYTRTARVFTFTLIANHVPAPKPIPEPATVALIALALIALGRWRRTHKSP